MVLTYIGIADLIRHTAIGKNNRLAHRQAKYIAD